MPNINTGMAVEYDSSCPNLHCFEGYPCSYVDSASALPQVKYSPRNTVVCYKLPNINTGMKIE